MIKIWYRYLSNAVIYRTWRRVWCWFTTDKCLQNRYNKEYENTYFKVFEIKVNNNTTIKDSLSLEKKNKQYFWDKTRETSYSKQDVARRACNLNLDQLKHGTKQRKTSGSKQDVARKPCI